MQLFRAGMDPGECGKQQVGEVLLCARGGEQERERDAGYRRADGLEPEFRYCAVAEHSETFEKFCCAAFARLRNRRGEVADFQSSLLQQQFRGLDLRDFGDNPAGHALFCIFAPEADGAAVLCTPAAAAALDGVLHRDGKRAQYVHLLAVVVEAHALDTAIDNARYVRDGDGGLGDVRGEYDARAFRHFEDAVLRFAVLAAVEFKELCDIVAQRFAGGGMAAGNFGLAWQKYKSRLPDVVAVQRAERPHHFGFEPYARCNRRCCCRSLVDYLDGVERVPEYEALDAECRFEFFAVERRRHDSNARSQCRRCHTFKIREQQVHVGLALVVFVEYHPLGV